MGTRGRIGGLSAVASVLVLATTTTLAIASSVAAQPPGNERLCEIVGFSPHFETDRTSFCVSREYAPGTNMPTGNLIVRKSTDGMSSWEQLPAAGLQGLGLVFPSQVIASPEYPTDDTVYVHVVYGNSPGLYRSTDGGKTFVNVAPLASTGSSYRALSPFLGSEAAPAPLGGGREAFAYATPEARPALVMPPLHRPVVGAPEATDMFLLPPSFPDSQAVALVRGEAPESQPTKRVSQVSAYACDASLACATRLNAFPAGYVLANAGVAADGVFYVALKKLEDQRELQVWRSHDDGSFSAWDSLNRRMPAIPDDVGVFEPKVSVVAAPGSPGRYYARISYGPGSHDAGPPADQVLESLDGGQTWRRRSFGRTYTQKGPSGTIPWGRRIGASHAIGDLYMPSSDRLAVIAQSMNDDGSTYTGVFCSFDRGRSWSTGCMPRL